MAEQTLGAPGPACYSLPVMSKGTKMNESPKAPTVPYVGYETFKNSVRGLGKAHLPDRIDNSVFPTMSNSARAQLIGAMKYLGLIDDKGIPAKELRDLATADDAGWKSNLKSILTTYYPSQLKTLETGTVQTFKDSFGPIGGIAIPAARFLLTAARDAGLKVSAHIKKISGGERKKKKPEEPSGSGAAPAAPAGNNGTPPRVTGDAFTDALLSKFPAFDTTWTEAQQERWFKAYEQLLNMKKGAV
jgi:hypothetical protein